MLGAAGKQPADLSKDVWYEFDFASHDRPSDGGAQAGMGKSNGFLMVAIGTEAVGVNIDV